MAINAMIQLFEIETTIFKLYNFTHHNLYISFIRFVISAFNDNLSYRGTEKRYLKFQLIKTNFGI